MEKGVRGGRACVCPCWLWSPSGAVRGLCAGHRGAESGPLCAGPGGTWLRVQVGTFGKVTLASKLWASPSGTRCWLGPGSSLYWLQAFISLFLSFCTCGMGHNGHSFDGPQGGYSELVTSPAWLRARAP